LYELRGPWTISLHPLGGEVEMTLENRPDAVAIISTNGEAIIPGPMAVAAARA
jgi:hypothetical protein